MKKLLLVWLPALCLLALPSQGKAFLKLDCGLGAYIKLQCGCNKQFNLGAFKTFGMTCFDECYKSCQPPCLSNQCSVLLRIR